MGGKGAGKEGGGRRGRLGAVETGQRVTDRHNKNMRPEDIRRPNVPGGKRKRTGQEGKRGEGGGGKREGGGMERTRGQTPGRGGGGGVGQEEGREEERKEAEGADHPQEMWGSS